MEVDLTLSAEDVNPLEEALYSLPLVRLAGEFDPDVISQLAALKERKKDAKTCFINTLYNKNVLEAIKNEKEVNQADEKLKATMKELQKSTSDLENSLQNIHSLCETSDQAFNLIKTKITELETKSSYLEERKKVLENLKNVQNQNNKDKISKEENEKRQKEIMDVIGKVEENIKLQKLKIRKYEMSISRAEERIELLKNINSEESVYMFDQQKLESHRQLLHHVESLGEKNIKIMSDNQIQIEFKNTTIEGDKDKPTLILTVEFKQGYMNTSVLANAMINNPSLDVNDIVEDCVRNNDLKGLVSQLKTRWYSHVPLLTEITHLQNSSAIDWIQEDSLLRVMVGKGGSVVCTLSIPFNYPLHGSIQLVDIRGCKAEAQQIQTTTDCKALEEWVEYLEGKFGKP
ncbi:hypothetical protein LOTGIDRAFT_227895 [Lottia gigantea]|uniref:Uncharacterized protein n=1 Tax=Lottia gigantea TaxID=225164 RepID=V4CRT8_LOTGI|nr:hypothetical protein LOTGIDRAFT_227895 [Lottia gigantea]ESP05240.1 hypothetical protein LOTGIDRAFT_227895 [Lottia gigantea]